jgi:hypothetical protein
VAAAQGGGVDGGGGSERSPAGLPRLASLRPEHGKVRAHGDLHLPIAQREQLRRAQASRSRLQSRSSRILRRPAAEMRSASCAGRRCARHGHRGPGGLSAPPCPQKEGKTPSGKTQPTPPPQKKKICKIVKYFQNALLSQNIWRYYKFSPVGSLARPLPEKTRCTSFFLIVVFFFFFNLR